MTAEAGRTAIGVTCKGDSGKQQIEDYCSENALSLSKVFTCRKDGPTAIAEACDGGAMLVAKSLSCVAESTLDVVRLGIRLKEAGAGLAVIDSGIGADASDGVLKLLASLGDLEYHRVADHLPYGYAVADDLEHIVVDADESAVIKRVIDWYREDVSVAEIAAKLNAEKVPARPTEAWTGDAIQTVVDAQVTSRWDGME